MKTQISILTLTALAAALALSLRTDSARMMPEVRPIPHHGGKPRIPVTVSTASAQVLSADTASTVVILIRPEAPCTELTARFRSIDGVEILGDDEVGGEASLGSCQPGENFSHELVIRAGQGTSGYVVVDLEMDGVPATLAVPFKAFGAKSRPAPVGKISLTEEGERVMELNPELK